MAVEGRDHLVEGALFEGVEEEKAGWDLGERYYPPSAAPEPKPSYTPFIPGIKPEEARLDIQSMDQLIQLNLQCQRCELRAGCMQVVCGRGYAEADLMLIGEGPGADEDEQGLPFVGRAGKLLDKILAAAELSQDEIYIANMVKCRPPNNRLPHPVEIKACRGWLEAQIRLVAPKIIICLGNAAAQSMIDPKLGIGKLRGRWYERAGVKLMATYHPAALLRNESYKRPVWEDFKQIRDEHRRLHL